MVCRYSGGIFPCGTTVPIIDVTARPMRREIDSLREQKKSQSDSMKFRLLVDKTNS